MIGDYPLSRFLCVRELLSREKLLVFTVVALDEVPLEAGQVYCEPSDFSTEQGKRSSRNSFSTLRKKMATVSSWSIESYMSFRVGAVSKLNCDEYEVGVQVGIFHGGRSLCEPRKTSSKQSVDGECTWDELLSFDIRVTTFGHSAFFSSQMFALPRILSTSSFLLANMIFTSSFLLLRT